MLDGRNGPTPGRRLPGYWRVRVCVWYTGAKDKCSYYCCTIHHAVSRCTYLYCYCLPFGTTGGGADTAAVSDGRPRGRPFLQPDSIGDSCT